MNWLCWHVGTVTDPKFSVIARTTKTPKTTVLCVWAAMLEHAKQNDGCVMYFDTEATGELLGVPEEHVDSIVHAMQAREMIDREWQIANWTKRQHQKSTQRVKEFRERAKRNETNETVSSVSRNSETHETGQTDRQTNTHTDNSTTYSAQADLPERVEIALAQPMPVFGLTAAVEMLTSEGFTESELLDTARSIAARGKTRVNPNYFIQAARGMKDDASRQLAPARKRNSRDASSPDAIGQRRAEILEGLGIGVSGAG